ncbi:MAG: VanW family protein [Clostridia bacterium]|jgi:vancomycin resistance protein YoaR
MESASKKKSFRFTKKTAIISAMCFVILLLAIIGGQLVYAYMNYDKVSNGVFINDVNVSNLTKSELQSKLNKLYASDNTDKNINFKSKTMVVTFSYPELDVKYNLETLEKKVLAYGKDGNIFQNIINLFYAQIRHKTFTLQYSYNKKKLSEIITNLYDSTCLKVVEPETLYKKKSVTISEGTTGEDIDHPLFIEATENIMNKFQSGTVAATIIADKPELLNADKLYNQVQKKVVNASIKVKDDKITYIEESNGRQIDKKLLVLAVDEILEGDATEKTIPIKTTYPKITTNDLEGSIFNDVLGEYSTQFYSRTENEINRVNNIKLASSKINGTILGPGQTFSYNNIVGQRTVSGGYKIAHVYSNGEIVSGVGGGICQVSTTLYNAVLFAGLEVVERRNHMFTVSYVDYGRDATVSYGSTDFRFRNSTSMPIKIIGYTLPGERLYFKIIGTNPNPEITYKYDSVVRSTVHYSVVYNDDNSLKKGYTETTQNGMNGYVADVYKSTLKNGKVIKRVRLSTNVYKALNQIVLRGTKGLVTTSKPKPSKTPKPAPTKSPKPVPTKSPTPPTSSH